MNDTQRVLLGALEDGPVRGPRLADELGLSRTAVWKAVESLRRAGFDIESTEGGYVVRAVPEYGAAAIEYGLDAPYTVEYHDVLGSSNDRARELAADGAENVVVVADEQTSPRGRLSREWSSPPGGIWLSVVLRPTIAPSRAPLFTLAMGVAITRAVRDVGVDAGIKWPNDVLVASDASAGSGKRDSGSASELPSSTGRGGRKLAGVLTEMEGEADRISWLIIGVGLNANVDLDALPDGATSLRACRREQMSDTSNEQPTDTTTQTADVERRLVVQRLLEAFHDLREDPDAIVPAWREHALTLGRRVRVETPQDVVEGTAVDVTDLGALVIRTDDGEVTVHAGDCEHLRPSD